MRSAVSQELIGSQSESPLMTPVIGKCLQLCRRSMGRISVGVKQAINACSGCLQSQYDNAAYDDFDWGMNELACDKGHQHSLPSRAWKRHSAVLTMAYELSSKQTMSGVSTEQ